VQLNLVSATVTGGTIADNGTLDSTGTSSIGVGTIVNNNDILESTGGTLTIHDAVDNAGTLEANGGTLVIDGDISGAGSATISGGGTLDLGGADAQAITFEGAGTLQLETSSNLTGSTVSGFEIGDVIDLAGLPVTPATTVVSTARPWS
jgi:hypothetical protein